MTESKSTINASKASREQKTRMLRDIIATHLKSLQLYHQAVLESEDASAIHKVRVTTRRLQAAIDMLQTESKLKKQLRKWRRSLSTVRNADVFLAMIEKEMTARRSVHRRQYELLKMELQKRRARRARKIRPYLEQIDLASLASKLGLNPVNWTDRSESLQMIDGDQLSIDPIWIEYEIKATSRAADRLEQRLNQLQALTSAVQDAACPERVHQLRIAIKRLRYLLEVISEMGYCDASRALEYLKSLQDGLGNWHDLDAFKQEIIRIVSRRRFLETSMGEAGQMLQAAARLLRRKEALTKKLFPIKLPRTLLNATHSALEALRSASTQASKQ
jgi:CHAD domain-containing protein